MDTKEYAEKIASRIEEGFVKDVTSPDDVQYPGLKGSIKRYMDLRREAKNIKDIKEREKAYNKIDKILSEIEIGLTPQKERPTRRR